MRLTLPRMLCAVFGMLLLCSVQLHAQFKEVVQNRPLDTTTSMSEPEFIDLLGVRETFSNGKRVGINVRTTPYASEIQRDDAGHPVMIDLQRMAIQVPKGEGPEAVLAAIRDQRGLMGLSDPMTELEHVRTTTDIAGNQHWRYRQVVQGIPVYGSELVVHSRDQMLSSITGRWTKTPDVNIDMEILNSDDVETLLRQQFDITGNNVQISSILPSVPQVTMEEVIFNEGDKPVRAYYAVLHPNPAEHLHVLMNAVSGEILKSYSAICDLMANYHESESNSSHKANTAELSGNPLELLLDGDVTATDTDLTGSSRTFHCYQQGQNYFMVDISRPMFNQGQSSLPNEPAGAIWTIDGNGGSPRDQNFQVSHVSSGNNQWDALEVSAHWNGTVAYEYFRTTFNRNSINGDGGTIISVIDVTEQNGAQMDNAFWNGYAMFYGNGDRAFSSPLAKALDVAGHEMSHGVIQNTANLEYVGQSGALNESFADIFGAMIDREDWLMGEDVVNPQIFPSGALRNLQNPNNGVSQGQNGWQPAHMDEFVNLPNTPQGDNGGVHINSGIPNRAYYLFATEVGRAKAEQVFYSALTNYLVRSSQFIDARVAVVEAAADLYGNNSDEVRAARDAFAGVGLFGDEGGDYEEELDVNPGESFLLISNNDLDDIFLVDPGAGNVFPLDVPPPFSKPSVTDDGTAAVYVDQNGFLKALLFDWSGSSLSYEVVDIESSPQPIWRNIAVSKDGGRISFLTDELDNIMYVFDFVSQELETFELTNPTTASNGEITGGVQYADAMEWDFNGRRIVYDAFNVLPGTFGDDIEYWDIGFLDAWNPGTEDFGTGQIQKLFTNLPENVNVGNPSFAKNQPDILVFDFLEIVGNSGNWAILASNKETGRVELIFENDALGYPNYSMDDGLIVFDTKDPNDLSQLVVGAVDTDEDDIMVADQSSARVYINGARLATWFGTGVRELVSTSFADLRSDRLKVYPNPASDQIQVELEDGVRVEYVEVVDMQGRQILQRDLDGLPMSNRSTTLALPEMSSGMYVLRAITEDKKVLTAEFLKY